MNQNQDMNPRSDTGAGNQAGPGAGHDDLLSNSLPPASPPDRTNSALDQMLDRNLQSAEVVFHGRVSNLIPVPASGRITHHDPSWVDAIVVVYGVLRGEDPGYKRAVQVRFADSTDVAWNNAPKFKIGDEGIFLISDADWQKAECVLTNPEHHYTMDKQGVIEAKLGH